MSTPVPQGFISAYPLDLSFADQDGSPNLYVASPDPDAFRTLTVSIKNASTKNLYLKPLSGAPTASASHFALQFDVGTFTEGYLKQGAPPLAPVTQSLSPEISAATVGPRVVTFYVGVQAGGTLKPGEAIQLTLKAPAAKPQPTAWTHAVLTTGAMIFTDAAFTVALSAKRKGRLQVLNLAARDLPLGLEWRGPSQVLNTGAVKSNDKLVLTLRVSNRSGGELVLYDPSSAAGPRLRLSFDESSDPKDDAALGTSDQVAAIAVKVQQQGDPNQHAVAVTSSPGKRSYWDVPFDKARFPQASLKPGAWFDLELDLSAFTTVSAAGPATVYLAFERSPAFGDGLLTAHIDKQPLVFSGAKVGVGTLHPQSPLHVSGALKAQTLSLGPAWDLTSGDEPTAATSTLNARRGYGYELQSADSSTRLASWVQREWAGLGTRSPTPLGFYTDNGGHSMLLDTSGQLGVGTAPSATLHVKAEAPTLLIEGSATPPTLRLKGGAEAWSLSVVPKAGAVDEHLSLGPSGGALPLVVRDGALGFGATSLGLTAEAGSTLRVNATHLVVGQGDAKDTLSVHGMSNFFGQLVVASGDLVVMAGQVQASSGQINGDLTVKGKLDFIHFLPSQTLLWSNTSSDASSRAKHFACSTLGVPSGAQAVILATVGGDNNSDTSLRMKPGAALACATDSDKQRLSLQFKAMLQVMEMRQPHGVSGDIGRILNQGIFPVDSAGLNLVWKDDARPSMGWSVSIVGWFGPAA